MGHGGRRWDTHRERDCRQGRGGEVVSTMPLEIARRYLARGFAVVPIGSGQKGPKLKDWQKLRLTADVLPQYFDGHPQNIGVILGEASGNLADIDL